MKKIFLLSFFISINVIAQNRDLGKVTIQELEEKVCPIDSSAVAAILFSTGDVRFDYTQGNGFTMTTTVKTKIKIYKKEGYDWANKAVNYYIGSSPNEKLSFSNVITYNFVNGKIEKTKLKSDGEFNEKVNQFWGRKKISMPNVKEGSIIEYDYTLISSNFGLIDKWVFQSSIPVLYSEFNVVVPEYYSYKPAFRGFITPKIITDRKSRTITLTSKSSVGSGFNAKSTIKSDSFTYSENISKYILTNIPAIKDEKFTNNIKNYISSVELELSSIQFPGEPVKTFLTDWESVVKKIYENNDFGNELNKTGYYEKDIDAILAGLTKSHEKINAIFTFVKSKMNWNEFYGYSCNDGVKKAYQEKKGNVAEINLMLTSMLRFAGIEANPILISTRGNGIALFPSRSAFDYVISGVELNNEIILLDATNKYSLPNILPIRDLNWFGRLIRKDGSSSHVDLMPKINSKEAINLMADISATGEVAGKVRDQYFDYNAFQFRDNYNGLAKESLIEKIEKKHQGLEVENYDVQNNNDLSKPIVENYSFTSNNAVEIIGNKMYFSPFFHFALTENPFKQDVRLYPIDFVYPAQDKYVFIIKIPENYIVETLPESKAVGLPNNYGNFKYNISLNGNQIQMIYSLDINSSIIDSDMYDAVKVFFKEMVNKQTEKVVLKKI
jgi:hypothetical protein